ncbi:hypothetical protein DFR72_12384 [Lentzea flaviverrucosa]|uniref:Uncharacterized protein n=1 Tax=Lentzea flaviverrucosa TaxID=200379 RepID=A0A1H9IZI8_9PSEU|nr:hypothetical protein DFR72_12384 [Lentzea flaviverrucosa]SEQ80211.1 hypothetical protein SAMN05216195_10384 [Lentzea flaviverrucosa]
MLVAGVAVAATLTAVTAAVAFAGGETVTGSIACPQPVVPAVPAAAQAEVQRELANLDKQIAEANNRLRTSAGEGGPNFVQNAILGPLASKRVAALNRIETAIGRVAEKPEGLERFATCGLGQAPAVSAPATTTRPASTSANAGTGSAAGQVIECPLPVVQNVPAAARAEVDRELANLGKQLAEANERLRTSAGQGGPNFVQNAILGPLASKRNAALDRIAISIGRVGARPQGLERFATCSLK